MKDNAPLQVCIMVNPHALSGVPYWITAHAIPHAPNRRWYVVTGEVFYVDVPEAFDGLIDMHLSGNTQADMEAKTLEGVYVRVNP